MQRYADALLRTLLPSSTSLSELGSITNILSAAAGGPVDRLYSRLGSLNGPFFPAGWGDLAIVNYSEDAKYLVTGEVRLQVAARRVAF